MIGYHKKTVGGNWFGGESRDELVDGSLVINTSTPAGWSIITSPVATGVAAWACNADGSHQAFTTGDDFIVTQGPIANYITAFNAQIRLSAAPSTAFCLAGMDFDSTYALECGTDRKVRLVKLGTGASRWTNRTALSGWSATAIPTNSYIHLALFIDMLTLNMPETFFVLVVGGSEQWNYYTGSPSAATAWFPCANIENINSGIIVYWDDMVGLITATASDAPHLVSWPKPEVRRQLAIGDTAEDDWRKKGGAGGSGDYGEWDDDTGNDGDTSYNYHDAGDATDKQQASDGQTAASVGITGHTVIHQFDDSEEGPFLNIVHKNANDGTKFGGKAYNSLGINPVVEEPGTVYEGFAVVFPQVGGWTVSDLATLEFGLDLPYGAQHNQEWRVTLCMMQWLTYASTLPKTTPPSGGQPGAGEISTDTLVATSFSPAERRFGSVLSSERINPASGTRRFGDIPSDELVPNDWT